MKKLLSFLVIFLISITAISDVNKFKVTFSITFDEMTLEEAAEIEKQLLKQFKDNCEIDIQLSSKPPCIGCVDPYEGYLYMEIKDVMPNYTYPSWVIDPEMLKSIGKNSEVEKP